MTGGKFSYRTEEELLAAAESQGAPLSLSHDLSALKTPLAVPGSDVTLKNRFTVHPMEGFDSLPDGGPGELTLRRIRRMASGGAGLVWAEATAVTEDGRTNRGQLWIRRETLDGFKRMAEAAHEASGGAPIILQLTHSGRFSKPQNVPAPVIAMHNPVMDGKMPLDPSLPVVTDEYLDALPEKFGEAAALAKEAGFDGADVKCCHKYLFSELLSAYHRPGRYGGSFENRSRLFLDSIRAAAVHGDRNFVIASRFGAFDCIPYPWGFGMDRDDPAKPDWEEPDRLYRLMAECGVRLCDMTLGSPYYNPHVNRPYDNGGYDPPESRLAGVKRLLDAAAHMKRPSPRSPSSARGTVIYGSSLRSRRPRRSARVTPTRQASDGWPSRTRISPGTSSKKARWILRRSASPARCAPSSCGKCTRRVVRSGTGKSISPC